MSILNKIKKIEAIIEQSSSKGEREAAILAKERILNSLENTEPLIEYRISTNSFWEKRLLIALCLKRGIKPYRYYRQKYRTTNIRISKKVMQEDLWPEFLKFSKILEDLVEDIIQDLIKKIWDKDIEEAIITEKISY